MTKISSLTALTGAGVDTAADLLPIVDMSLSGAARNKKILVSELLGLAFSGELVDDRVASLLVAGSNVTITYDDTANTLTIAAASTSGGITDFNEAVDDRVAALIQGGVGVTKTYDDAAGTLTLAAAASAVDNDVTLAADSATVPASQHAVKTYIANKLVGMFDLRGTTDCSANPNYPAAVKGDAYSVSVAGKIGGASGASVAVGDVYFALADNAGGTQAAVGASWDVLVHASVSAGGGLLAANNLSDLANASTARTNLALGTSATMAAEWAPNFTAAGDVYIPAVVAMTIDQGNAAIGTGTLTFFKSTTATPGTFNSTTLPATLQAGAWLKVTAAAVTGFVATHLKRTA